MRKKRNTQKYNNNKKKNKNENSLITYFNRTRQLKEISAIRSFNPKD